MIENKVRFYRKKLGFTQNILAKKTGLSLRTIQRVESGAIIPKGHTLTQLANVFNLDPATLQEALQVKNSKTNTQKTTVKLINLAALGVFLPFGNLIFPIWIWLRNNDSDLVDKQGRAIINFQIIWSICLYISLCVAPFLDHFFNYSIPLILMVLFFAVLINIFVILKTAIAIKNDRQPILDLPFQLL